MSIYASEFLKWLRIFGVTTGGGPAPTGALLAINNLDDVLNSTTSIENLGFGRPGILILTDADFAAGGGTYVLTNPPPIYISMSATSPGRVLQLPPQNQATSLQGSEDIRLLTGSTSEPININNGAGTLIFQVAADSAWQAVPNDRTTIAGAWEFLGIVMTINGSHTGNVVLGSDPQSIYVAPSGDNINGNGSVLFPYATLSHALAVATPSPTTPYQIIMQTGIYTETNLTLKANVFISGNQSSLTISGLIDLDVNWGSGGFLYIQNFESLSLPATVTLDFTAVFSPFSLFVFRNNIITSPVNTTLEVTGGIFISTDNFGFSSQLHYRVSQVYGAIQGGASGDIELTDVGNYSVIGMTEVGDMTVTYTQSGTMSFLHGASTISGNTLYRSTGPGLLSVLERGVSHFGGLTLDNGFGGGNVTLSSNALTSLPTLLNGATYAPDVIGEGIRANAYFFPSNYTPLAGPPGEWVADSLTGNLAGIDQALASGGSIPPAYAEMYFQGNTQPTSFVFPNDPVKVEATVYNSGELDGFTQVGGTFTYTGTALRTVQLTAMLTATYEGTVQNTSFYITKNGVPLVKSRQTSAIGFVTPSPEPLPVQATTQVVTGDTFELWASNDDNTNSLVVVDLNYSINGMSGSSANAGVPPSYAEMFFQNNVTPTPITNVNIPTKIVATYSADMLKDFTHSAGTLTYQGSVTKVFVLDADLTATYSGTAQNTSFYITVNGAVVAKSKQKTFIGPVTPADMPNPCHAVVSLASGSTVEVWVENNDNANDPTIVDFNLFVHSIDLIGTSPNISNLNELIWVNNQDGSDTNQGTLQSPMKTYEAARLLAKARGASPTSVFVIVPIGIFSVAGDFTVSPYINVSGLSLYNCSFSVSGSLLLDPEWQTANAPYAELSSFNLAVNTINLDYGAAFNPSGQSYLRFQNLSLQVANVTINGAGDSIGCENVIFNNCNNDIVGAGPNYTVDNVNLQMFNTQVSGTMNVSVTSAVTEATCVIQASQGPMGNMAFARPSTGKLEVHISACETYNTTLTINTGAFVFVDAASYGFALALTGGATLAQLRLTSFGDGINANANFTAANYTPIASATYAVNTLTANLAGIDAKLGTIPSVTNVSQLIYVNDAVGNDSNTGTIISPLKTYEAALIKAQGLSPSASFQIGIIPIGAFHLAAEFVIAPFIHVLGNGILASEIYTDTGVILDPAWNTATVPTCLVSDISIKATIPIDMTLTYTTLQLGSELFFQNILTDNIVNVKVTGAGNGLDFNCEFISFDNMQVLLQTVPLYTIINIGCSLNNVNLAGGLSVRTDDPLTGGYLAVSNCKYMGAVDITGLASAAGGQFAQFVGCSPFGNTLTISDINVAAFFDASSYQFFNIVFTDSATIASINILSLADGVEANANFIPVGYTPEGAVNIKASSVTGNLKGIDNKIAAMVEVLGVSTIPHTLYTTLTPTTVWDSLVGTNIVDAFSLQIGQSVEISVTGSLVGIGSGGSGQLTASFGSIFSVTSQIVVYTSGNTFPMEFKMRITRSSFSEINASVSGWFLSDPATVMTAWNMIVSPYHKPYDETVSNAIDLQWTSIVSPGNFMDFVAVNLQIVKCN